MTINNLVNYINDRGLFLTPDNIVKNAIFYFASCIVNFGKFTFNNKPINYFGATFAPSGMGKSFVVEEVKKMFQLDEDKINTFFLRGINPLKISKNSDIIEYTPTFTNPLEGTIEGLYLTALASSRMVKGSLNLISDEVLDTVTTNAQYFLKLKELYDGFMSGKVQKADPLLSRPLKNIKCNTLIFGTSQRLDRIKVLQSVLDLYESGFYRRSFTVVEMPQKTVRRKKILLSQNEKNEIDKQVIAFQKFIRKSITDEENVNIDIVIDDGALPLFERIQDELLEFQNNNMDDIKYATEFTAIHKIMRLSAIIALMNCRYSIFESDLKEAYQFHLNCRKDVKLLFANKVKFVMIFDALTQKPLLQTEIMEKFNIKTDEDFIREFKLVAEYSQRKKARLVTIKKRDSIKYEVKI